MERLTIQEIIDHCDRQLEREWLASILRREHEAVKAYLEELQRYQATGLKPEEIVAMRHTLNKYHEEADPLLRAKVEERLVVLPCKVGETAWVKDRAGVPREMRLCSPDIRFVCTDEDNLCMALCNRKPDGFCAYRLRNDGSDIGKTVFRTREDAENVLNPCDRCMSGSYRGCDGCGYAEKTPEGGEAGDY